MKDKYSKLLKDTAIFSLGSMGSKLILFFMVPLYTNYLTAEEYGTADLVFTAAQFMTPVISLVIYDAVIRYGLSKDYRREDVLRVSYRIISVDSVLVILLVPIIGLYTPLRPWKWYASVYMFLSISDSVNFNYLKVCGRNKLYALLSILKTAFMAALNVFLLVIVKCGVKGYLLANILSLLMTNIMVFLLGNYAEEIRKSSKNRELFREMLRFSIPLILNNISWWVIQSSDKVMVEYILGAAMLGIYTVAAKIPALINVIISIFSQAWGISSIAEYEESNDMTFYSTVQKAYMTIICAACIVFVSFIKIFMRFYVGIDFLEAWRYVPLLLVSAVFSSISSFYGSLYSALKKSVNNMISTVLSAALNIGINYALIPIIGVWGAVIGTAVAYFFIAMYRLFDVRRFVPIKMDWIDFFANCLIVTAQAILVSLDISGEVVSIVAIIAFCAVNYKFFVSTWKKTAEKRRRF